MVEKLWSLANIVTAFAVAQNLGLTYAVARRDLNIASRGDVALWFALGATVVFTALYVAAIMWCGTKGASLDTAGNGGVWRLVTAARVSAVVLFTAVLLLALYGHKHDGPQPTSPGKALGRTCHHCGGDADG
jgi:hypothetical protein